MTSRLAACSLALLLACAWTADAQTSKKALPKKGASAAKAGDWPAWRGPERNGISAETGLLKTWPDGGPKLLWKARGLGEGFSTPSVAGNLIFTMGNKNNQEFVLALDKSAEGKIVWETPLGGIRNNGGGYPGPRSTPTVDGQQIYTLGLGGDLVCLEAATGKIVWRQDITREAGGRAPNWGYSESVLVDGPLVLCTPGGDTATIAAFQKANGRPAWGAKLRTGAGYSSIVPAEINRVKQYVQFTASGVVAVNAKDGTPLWDYKSPSNGTANISTPIVQGNMVFAASGYGTGGGLAEVGRTGMREVYFTKEMKNHHGGVILLDGHIYGANDPGMLNCLDFTTGTVKWTSREPGKCALLCADGMLFCRGEDGPMTLVKANAAEYKQLGRFSQPDRSGQPAWAHPVVSEGRLYLRDQDVLLCYDVKE